jgi:hypothetical protein
MCYHYIILTLFVLCQTHIFAQHEPPKDLETRILFAARELPPKSYVFVDLDITDQELKIIDQLKVENYGHCDRFGTLHLLQDEIPEFLRNIGNDDEELIQEATTIIYKIITQVTKGFGKQTAWVSIRASLPNHDYDIPRWHMDGYYYSPYFSVQYKFAVGLKGNPTLFYAIDETMRDTYWNHFQDRETLSQLFDVNQAETAPKGSGAIFIVGNRNYSALHSEPKIDSKRIFMSILPGQDCEIEEFYNKNKVK